MEPHPETLAPAVVPPVIAPVETYNGSVKNRIITPYRADRFESILRQLGLWTQYSDLPHRLRTGFLIGEFDPLTRTDTPPNHLHRPEQLKFVSEYVREQVQLRRMSGPYTQAQVESFLGGPFMSSPIFLIPKAGSPGKFRLIQDCSFKNKDGFSVNDFIDSEKFPTRWNTALEVAQIVATAPAGAQAASLDIDSAYRNIPVHPDHKPFLVLQVQPGEFFIDHTCPFGPASGPGLQAQIMDAIIDILVKSDYGDIKAWVDDIVSFRYPTGRDWRGEWTYRYDVEDIFRVTQQLGIPWKRGKCFRYAYRVVYLGYLWNLEKRCVSLPREKRESYLATLNAFLDKARVGPVSMQDAMSITGTLSYLTFVYASGKAYLKGLSAFVASFADPPAPPAPQLLTQSLLSDLAWWRNILQQPTFVRQLKPRAKRDPGVWVDASSGWGIGIIIGQRWAAWKLNANWKENDRDIGWAEMVALELGCMYLDVLGYENVDIVVHCDNTGVIGAFLKGSSRNFQVNLSIRRVALLCTSSNFALLPEYVKSEDNRADSLSRGIIPSNGAPRLPDLPSLPRQLRKYLTRA